MKKPIFTKTNFTIPSSLLAQIEKNNNPTQADIDEAQTKQIYKLEEVDKKHDKQFVISLYLNVLYLVWLIALTGMVVLK